MFHQAFWSIIALPILYYLNACWRLYQNVQRAKRTGIPYVIVPWYNYNRLAGLTNRYWMRILDKYYPDANLPTTNWRRIVKINWPWNLRYSPFADIGSDNLFTVSPGGLIFHSADANVISQITSRSNDFPKPTHLYVSIDIYGKNIVSTEGAAWRHHRKMTAHSFTERNNQLVWDETLEQSQAMLASWVKEDSKGSIKSIKTVADDAMRLSLHVVSKAGLGEKMEWTKDARINGDQPSQKLPNGHTMNFTECLNYLLKNVLYVMVLSKFILRHAPSATISRVNSAYEEFGRYMQAMIAAKKSAAASDSLATKDLIGQLVKGQSDDNKESTSSQAVLTESEVMGNIFAFIIAGHETSASGIHFCIFLLALHPEAQRRVQKELDQILQGRPPCQWSYEADLPKLQNSFLNAVLHEQLRVIPPLTTIPKYTAATPQTLQMEGKDRTLPPQTMIRLCVPAVHRNPKFWPHGPPKNPAKPFHPPGSPTNDLEEFKPERWLNGDAKELYNPPKGAYIPFSLDARACLGKRFAQVEILAALACILSTHTIELAVDEFANDEEVEKMSIEEKRRAWEQARDRGNWVWQNKASTIMTLQLRGGSHVPVRVMRRGQERFGEDVVGRG